MTLSIADLRKDYKLEALTETEVDPDPIRQFQLWFDQAIAAQLPEPNAMTLATASRDGVPSARIVLLKGVDDRGFTFFTNYESHKGQELRDNPQAALVFLWHELERQVRIAGPVEQVSEAESDEYFQIRPLSSQLGAWVSPQSRVIPDRDFLEQGLQRVEAEYQGRMIPRPPHWGGYRVCPVAIEFWQGRPSRLHDRLCYRFRGDRTWTLERLSP
ncbi:pyridoxamine 5'-phosphate oxidase [Leptolyngbya sp. 'hensonii']|uniref:pyridoxamine 5'-phosphate oxidase n=1 Tax=Leptolyngbya sp. 'hensonii' TaxID=1922337 RepID=UPI0009502F6E|nr:pyridoxamine 5'-phosphate oxidase [Leptolyngbya sp. 'hensonii']OLP15690.1 pyridoxamine 5'-phosphate oxidase [Leptolyngbya sp. 'hensonii']